MVGNDKELTSQFVTRERQPWALVASRQNSMAIVYDFRATELVFGK